MIKITSDSTCDLTPDMLSAMDITLLPMYILSGDKVFRDGVDMTPAELFRIADTTGKLCKTSALNIEDYQRFFSEFSPRYEAVIHLNLGLGFSVCYQNAVIAAQDFPNVYVVDSRNLSTGHGYLVRDAARKAKEGKSAPEICAELERDALLMDASFVIDRMDYLHLGGRCSGLEAIGARLLNIKPCIEVADGKMRVGKKYRGRFEDCLERYVKDRLYQNDNIDLKRLFITHPMCSEGTVARVREAVAQYASFEEVVETRAGCSISNHCGPNTLGIIYKRRTG